MYNSIQHFAENGIPRLEERLQAAELWDISVRRVQRLCKENRVEGAININRIWLIPRDTEKPADMRRKNHREMGK